MYKKIIFGFIAVSIIACKSETKNNEAASSKDSVAVTTDYTFSAEQARNLPIELENIESVSTDAGLAVNGIVDVPPDQMYEINFPLEGKVSHINHAILPGRFLKKGEPLAEIQSLSLLQTEEDYVNEKIKSEFLQQEFDRQKTLLEQDATAKRKFQEVSNQLKLINLKIKSLAEKLKVLGINPEKINAGNISGKHQIFSPSNAYVKAVHIANGKNFVPGESLFELVSTEHIHAELKVFGDDMEKVKAGQKVEFMDASGAPVLGEVYLLDRTVDAEQKSLNIHVHIENKAFEQTLRPGQYISAKIQLKDQKVKGIKESAILNTSDGTFIFVKKETKEGAAFEKIAVKVGKAANGYVELLSPQNISGSIVTKGANFIENSKSEE